MAYFILADALSWAIELPLAAAAQGWLHTPVPPALHYLASIGPMLSALIVTAATEGRQGIRQLLAGVVNANCRERDVFVIQPLVPPVQEHLMELLLMLDAARGVSAARTTAVIPYYCVCPL